MKPGLSLIAVVVILAVGAAAVGTISVAAVGTINTAAVGTKIGRAHV